MKSKIIKKLHKTSVFNEGTIFFPLYNKDIAIFIDFDVDIEYAEKCVQYLQNLNDNLVDSICGSAIKYCEHCRPEFTEDEITRIPERLSGRAVLKYMTPVALIVENPKNKEVIIHMEWNCDWEIEHGLELIIRNDELLFLSSFCGEVPYRERDYFKNLSWNYAN